MEQDSFDSLDDQMDSQDVLVLAANNLRLGGPAGNEASALEVGASRATHGQRSDELPKSVIVTNVGLSVFDDEQTKAKFECIFREFEACAAFHYLRSFRRIRVDFESHLSASKAKVSMDNTPFGETVINCYFVQVLSPCTDEEAHLHPPALTKQFLISPPTSPPVGWEQPREDRPVVDYDLLAAMASLAPGEKHELHPTKQINLLGKSVSTPSIVVHIADENEGGGAHGIGGDGTNGAGGCYINGHGGAKAKIRQTRCPERQSSLE